MATLVLNYTTRDKIIQRDKIKKHYIEYNKTLFHINVFGKNKTTENDTTGERTKYQSQLNSVNTYTRLEILLSTE